jgi:hypothetical protein
VRNSRFLFLFAKFFSLLILSFEISRVYLKVGFFLLNIKLLVLGIILQDVFCSLQISLALELQNAEL